MQSFLDGHYYREHMNDFSIETVCKMFHVSTSGYYSWLGKTRDIASRKAKEERDRIVKDCMLKIVKNRHYVPGKRTFKLDLERSFELQVSLRRIRSLMKEMNLVANVPKKDPYKHQATNGVNLTKSTENSVVKPNIRSGPHCSHCSVYKCYFRMISPIDREFISIT